jgi:hypothetical protein
MLPVSAKAISPNKEELLKPQVTILKVFQKTLLLTLFPIFNCTVSTIFQKAFQVDIYGF